MHPWEEIRGTRSAERLVSQFRVRSRSAAEETRNTLRIQELFPRPLRGFTSRIGILSHTNIENAGPAALKSRLLGWLRELQ